MRSSSGPLKLFVGDIGDNRKSDLSRVFSKYGEISSIYIDEKKHFAFVEFTASNDAQRALKHTNSKTVNGSRLRVEYAKPDKLPRDGRRPISRERSPASTFYNHLQVTANRLPPLNPMRQSYYQHPPSGMMPPAAMSRGRSLTPPSFKQNARVSSMTHLRSQDFYPPYYSPHPAMYTDPAYYRAYGDPYLMQRLPPPPPPTAFFRSTSPSLSRNHRNMYSSSGLNRHSPVTSRKRSHRSRSRSRSRRRSSPARRDRSSRERKRKRRTSGSSSPKPQRDRGPQTPPTSQRMKKRSRSNSDTIASTSEQKSPSASSSSSDDEKQSNSKRSQNNDTDQKHSKRKTRE